MSTQPISPQNDFTINTQPNAVPSVSPPAANTEAKEVLNRIDNMQKIIDQGLVSIGIFQKQLEEKDATIIKLSTMLTKAVELMPDTAVDQFVKIYFPEIVPVIEQPTTVHTFISNLQIDDENKVPSSVVSNTNIV